MAARCSDEAIPEHMPKQCRLEEKPSRSPATNSGWSKSNITKAIHQNSSLKTLRCVKFALRAVNRSTNGSKGCFQAF